MVLKPTAFGELLRTADFDHEIDRKVATKSADFGRHYGLKRIAVHFQKLDPNRRTSLPHAESLEEEFVYVLKGAPQLWQNGELYQLGPGDCVGFPSGTGICHSIVNNTCAEVELIVAGERSKPDNKCIYSVDKDLDAKSSIRWSDPPIQTMGTAEAIPHLGVEATKQKSQRPANIKDSAELFENEPFSYPTCKVKETFSRGRDSTSATGLQKLGIWIDRIPPGHRSSWPHAHLVEEEFVFVVKGRAEAWIDGDRSSMNVGDGIGFVSGTGVAHTIANSTDEDVYLFVLGERVHPGSDKVFYPQHPDQNEHNKLRGVFWDPKQNSQ